ncbi:g1642 [Coccomyxa elongata]
MTTRGPLGLFRQFELPSHRSHGSLVSTRRRSRLQCFASDAAVRFTTTRGVAFGEVHKIVGGHASLGDWNVDAAPTMQWSDGDVWSLDVTVPSGSNLEFKCVKVSGGGVEWEGGNNRNFQVEGNEVNVGFEWGNEGSLSVDAKADAATNGVPPTETLAGSPEAEKETEAASSEGTPSANGAVSASSGDDRLLHQQWQGRSTRFMRSNEHGRERSGVWSTEGLDGAALAIVKGDEKAGSWLQKMQVAKKVLIDEAPSQRPGLDELANAFIYLQFISTGAIECVEGGGHYRPNKHAELARDIFRALERLLADPATGREPKLLSRKTHTKLPSFNAEFTASTPLTRIRDIAHRNDIPHELKQEIKHTIQNKLHRNAGPEDLVATEEMLARVSAPDAGYSPDFVNEFRVFTGELRDFFNAGSLGDLLEALRPSLDDSGNQVLDRFLEAKGKVDAGAAANQEEEENQTIDALHALTSVRALLLSGLQSGVRNDASEDSLAMRQRWRLAEIRCEDYAFVLLSRFLNLLDARGSAEGLAEARADKAWSLPLGAAVLGVRQLGLSGWEQTECFALENEIGAWQQAGKLAEPVNALRLKASLERLQRLTQGYADAMLAIFPERAATLGSALGLEPERVTVFTEAEIRASVVFQLSKLVTLLLKAARLNTGAGAWDALVAGEVVGRLMEVEHLEAGAIPEGTDDPVVLLVRSASGDEEVGAAGANLKAVILRHSLPHLSHLGVRARQEKVPFATCEDEGIVDAEVKPLVGSRVRLTVSTEGVSISAEADGAASSEAPSTAAAASSSNGAAGGNSSNGAAKSGPGAVEKVGKAAVAPLEKATPANCGAKAAACAQLTTAAAKSGFRTPAGVCVPFGCMEAAVKESGKAAEFEELLGEIESAKLEGGALDAACSKLHKLVEGLRLPASILKEACGAFPEGATLIARSSANVEDLAGMSGAGLYESLAGVPAAYPDALGAAVSGVWASLYARRAVLSRRAAGVAQADAAMAVLIQEQLGSEYSFVLHTRSPVEQDPNLLYAELAAGLGETLASGTRGSPWRLAVNKRTGEVKTLAFANFSAALMAAAPKKALVAAGAGSPSQTSALPSTSGYRSVVLDYGKQALSTDEERRAEVGKQLAEVGAALEEAFGGPQDVEGALIGSEVYIVQTRPQP